tara:strand:- start:15039 stop:15890 length:852 start_codon:yes stop_codon:yes gene_type:complete
MYFRNSIKLLPILCISSNDAFIISTRVFHNSVLNARKKSKSSVTWDTYYDEPFDYKENKPTFKNIFNPKTPKQKEYYDDINNDDLQLVIGSGPAGTGKTLFPTQHAAKLLQETTTKIVLTRPLICVDEEIGYLPGGINEKMDPWIIPIFDILLEFFTQQQLDKFIGEKRIQIVPLAFMRGRTFKNTLIISDELQNTSINQMLMLLTRLGENSKIIITGDIHQSDNTENGLLDFIQKIEKKYDRKHNSNFHENLLNDKISLIEMSNNDVQRSEIINTILDIYQK